MIDNYIPKKTINSELLASAFRPLLRPIPTRTPFGYRALESPLTVALYYIWPPIEICLRILTGVQHGEENTKAAGTAAGYFSIRGNVGETTPIQTIMIFLCGFI
ncbi:hypothetical protein M7I_1644 [Glarea lozoyensis 74030]|uniref:Uncharacterized protein n=1 Tax=Glarea lozoyensis (strain ATCC 74030 / MF5533) TaxID=1104152 RepID=H0EGM7_GLAL7|nr:hypothetical protein M7I_1644 [Glarea lozoyensis 74030]